MSEHNAVVGIYNSHTDAEAAVKELQKSGFDIQKLSIVRLETTRAAYIAAHQG